MLIRRAVPEDLDTVGAITLAAYEPYLLGPDDPYAARLGNAAARALEAELWVAASPSGELLGSVTLCPDGSPWREVALADEGEFRMLAVAPPARGHGVGEALVRFCLDRFREVGAGAVVLSSLDSMAAAHRLYARLGFVRAPERDWSPAPQVSLIVYRLDLEV